MSVQGRKNASFTKEQLEELVKKGKSNTEIAWILNAGHAKVKKRREEWGLVDKK